MTNELKKDSVAEVVLRFLQNKEKRLFEESDPEDPQNAYDMSRYKFNCAGEKIKQ